MPDLYRFSCGCEWPVLTNGKGEGELPKLDFDIDKAPDDCAATWELLGRGETKGVFQLESPLGRQWCKKLKPVNQEHLGALGALLRPGCLKAVDEEGISMTQHYCRRRHNEEPVKAYHPAVDQVLEPTYGTLTYQEQAMALARAVAGFNLQDADSLRKAIGKKIPEEMAKCKIMFMEGAKKAGVVTEEMAKELFEWIEKSQRYSFNKSHAISYGLTGYDTAYIKAHFPLQFFTAWLLNAKSKQDPQQEVFELINDAKRFDIYVEPPDFRDPRENFHTDGKTIRFGLTNIKGVGDSLILKLKAGLELSEAKLARKAAQWTWYDFLVHFSPSIPSSIAEKLIQVGALRYLGLPRAVMLAEFKAWNELTEKEQNWIAENKFESLIDAVKAGAKPKKEGGACANKNRVSAMTSLVSLLENPPSKLVDTPAQLSYYEEQLLGIAVTCSKVDGCDISQVNCTCKDTLAGRTGFLILGVEIQERKEVKTKKGKTPGARMGRLVISDGTCSIEAVVFPDAWKEFGALCTEGNTVIIQGEKEKSKDYDSLIVKKVWQA